MVVVCCSLRELDRVDTGGEDGFVALPVSGDGVDDETKVVEEENDPAHVRKGLKCAVLLAEGYEKR